MANWEISDISAEEAAQITSEKRTGSLTIHFSQGKPLAFEWKQKITKSEQNGAENVYGPNWPLTPIRVDVV